MKTHFAFARFSFTRFSVTSILQLLQRATLLVALLVGSLVAVIPTRADQDNAPPQASTAVAPAEQTPVAQASIAQASKAAFVTGLKEPQGLALDQAGNILLCDYGAGEVLKYSPAGKLLAKVATGLNGPTQIVVRGKEIFVSERKANRVVKIMGHGKVAAVGGAIVQPLGLALDAHGTLFAVAHTSSKIYRFDGRQWNLIYAASSAGGVRRYGYRCLAYDGALLMSDEIGQQILMLTPGGRIAVWAGGIDDPSGIATGPNRATYVCNEGDGGQVLRLSAEGKAVVVAAGLGRPRNILFLSAKTALVSDRDGTVWKLSWP